MCGLSGGGAEVEGGQQALVGLGDLPGDALPERGFRSGELQGAAAPCVAHGAVDALPDQRIPDQAANVDLGQGARLIDQNGAARNMRVRGQADQMIDVHPAPVAEPESRFWQSVISEVAEADRRALAVLDSDSAA